MNATNIVVDDGYFLTPAPVWDALVAAVDGLRPWSDVGAVRAAILTWTRDCSSAPIDGLDCDVIAKQLKLIGEATNVPDISGRTFVTSASAHGMASLVLRMWADAVGVRDGGVLYGTGFEHVDGLSARTIRDYRSRFGSDAFHEWLATWQRHLDIAGLVARGRSPQAARAWLRRHPGKHARDAGPPRRINGSAVQRP